MNQEELVMRHTLDEMHWRDGGGRVVATGKTVVRRTEKSQMQGWRMLRLSNAHIERRDRAERNDYLSIYTR